VHVFWPVVEQQEVDIRPAILALQKMGKKIVMPVVESFSRQRTSRPGMRHALFTDTDALVANQWGIFEPVDAASIDPGIIDAAIVPALAIDEHGTRLGHGFGYYDEFLASLNTVTVCPVFDFARIKYIRAEPHDVRIAYTVTESGFWDNSGT
jgi:5-formyltetrahydrofolate cyclo-ligase